MVVFKALPMRAPFKSRRFAAFVQLSMAAFVTVRLEITAPSLLPNRPLPLTADAVMVTPLTECPWPSYVPVNAFAAVAPMGDHWLPLTSMSAV